MINGTAISKAIKTDGCGVTYRTGLGNPYASCPSYCPLMPAKYSGTGEVDYTYLDSLLKAVPRAGHSFTYSHFDWNKWFNIAEDARRTGAATVINYSADTWGSAVKAMAAGVPTTISVPVADVVKYRRGKIRAAQCPATYKDNFSCADCGGGKPLCARPDRDYAIVFPSHGPGKRHIGTEEQGGCYTGYGHVSLHANRYSKQEATAETDSEAVTRFVAGLRPGSIVRHHVIGDIGKEGASL